MFQAFARMSETLSQPLAPWARWLLVLAVVPLALGATQRLWTIHFLAPQYPRGLELHVYTHTISGGNDGLDLREINTLNHYVGMRALDPADFADLDLLPFALGVLALLALRAAGIGDVRALLDLAALTTYFGLFSLARFAYTLYAYGHHLDPKAPIRMDGFMPPLIGTKDIANFSVTSFPGLGTWLIAVFGATVVLLAAREILFTRAPRPAGGGRSIAAVIGLLAVGLALPSAPARAAEPGFERTEERAACRGHDPLRQPFFGDTHVHTTYSFDANAQDTRTTPREAYRFARGETLGLQPWDAEGKPQRGARLRAPLDFAAVTDHAELLGEVRVCTTPGLPGHDSDACWTWRQFPPLSFPIFATRNLIARDRFGLCGPGDRHCLEAAGHVWRDIQAAAEEAYDRSPECRFTSFVGYEWTGTVGAGINLHRNVIFRNAVVPALPASWVETPSAFDLWQHLQRDCVDALPGCDVLTIPHNSNLSGPGLMFESAKLTSEADAAQAVDAEEAKLRQRWEPLVEIMQHKGDSECLLGAGTTDEACGFEKLPYDSFAGVARLRQPGAAAPGADRRGMVREALKKGLVLEEKIGANPLKYGIIASTDTHLGTPGLTAEAEAKGHGGAGSRTLAGLPDDIEFNPGGLAVLWAEENSRDALFAAMERREAYGTSGTRPVVRFFGGWGYADDLCQVQDFAARGYAGGVPMGGDLPARPSGASGPRFAVWAAQDAGNEDTPGTPLQRVQIVKGWVESGAARERVFDVAGGDNGARVDPSTCDTKGPGSIELCAVWSDPDFDPAQRAFYYARVLENPTCRWSQRLCVEARVDCADPASVRPGFEACCSALNQPVVQERAWTSPIWYAP
jgi:hypothetical protein